MNLLNLLNLPEDGLLLFFPWLLTPLRFSGNVSLDFFDGFVEAEKCLWKRGCGKALQQTLWGEEENGHDS